MCGIAGFVGRADERLISAMTSTLVHRGPDGGGVRVFPSANGGPPAALGHRRLSIIDPTPLGAQPMSYGNDRYWITYNGELYNFRELRAELARDGDRFESNCDTEVLLALYARYGEAMLDRLNGIFAFGIWDTERRELFLARDRLGVKPLYYAESEGVLYFASEVKALLPALGRPRLRHDAFADYLTFLWVPHPDTIFEGVWMLPPGHCALSSGGRLRIRQYWDVPLEPEEGSEEQWARELRRTVQESVRRQMVSDVPLGSFLSGGIDSSAIVAEASSVVPRLTTYTVGFAAEDLPHEIVPDDVRYAREVGRLFGVDYHEETLRADLVELLPKLVWHLDEPIADPACITTYLICSAARENLVVILSGMGGDEVFAGYYRHLAAKIGRIADHVPRRARSASRRWVAEHVGLGAPGRLRGPRRNLRKLSEGIDADPVERYLTYCSYYRPDQLQRVLAPDLRAELQDHDPFRHHRAHFDRAADMHWLNRLLYVDQKTFLPCLNLNYTDKMSMAASTEVRVPLLDDEIIALAGRIPPELKLRRFTRKYLLRKSMEPVLPRSVIRRRKAGFSAPIRSWLVGDLAPLLDEVLSPEAIRRRGLLDPDEVQRIRRANDEQRGDYALQLWAFLTIELWQQAFLDQPVLGQAA
jgi:asparagine synthase (glutamine-hydrolysing)